MQEPSTKKIKVPFYKRWFYLGVEVFKGFIDDDCYLKASALTFYSLLSIVPILAVLFGIAKGFGFEELLQQNLEDKFSGQKEVVNLAIDFSHKLLQSVQGGIIAGIGVVLLLWTAFGLLNNIESALNTIWKIKKGRSYGRKINDFLAFLIICPIIFIIVSSLNVYISAQITLNPHNYAIIKATSPILVYIIKLFPYFLSWILFSFVYLILPHAPVSFRSGAIAGIVAGTVFQIWQWAYIKFQIGASSYSPVYGSFAALPLFLIWLQSSWLIVLAGAEIAAALDRDPFMRRINRIPYPVKVLAILVVYRCIDAFEKGLFPPTDRKMAEEMGVELENMYKICDSLQSQRILIATTANGDKISGYVPAKEVRLISIKDVCDAVDESDRIPANLMQTEELDSIIAHFKQVDNTLSDTKLNKLVIDIKK